MWTIEKIKQANRRTGHYFFSRDAMRFFNSRILDQVYEGPGGVYFVTSEQFTDSAGHAWPRKYTVRKFNPVSGDVGTVMDARDLSKYHAVKLARERAEAVADHEK